jgi:hypothetical protein
MKVLNNNIIVTARSHKYGRQGGNDYEDDEDEEGGAGFSYGGASGFSYGAAGASAARGAAEDDDDDDDDSDYDPDGDDEDGTHEKHLVYIASSNNLIFYRWPRRFGKGIFQ